MLVTPNLSRSQIWTILLLFLVGLAGGLYIHGFRGNLPYHLDVDEPVYYVAAGQIRQTGLVQIKPNYPPLRFYEMALEAQVADTVTGAPANASVYAIYARAGSAFGALVLLAIVFRIGRDFHSPLAGLLASILLAFDKQMIAFSHLARADTWAWMFGAAAIWVTLRWTSAPTTQNLAAVIVLSIHAFLAKYSILPMLVVPGIVIGGPWLRYRRVRWGLLASLLVGTGVIIAAILFFRADPAAWRLRLTDINLEFILDNNWHPLDNLIGNLGVVAQGAGYWWSITCLIGTTTTIGLSATLRGRFRKRPYLFIAVIAITCLLFTLRNFRYWDGYQVIIVGAILGGIGLAIIASYEFTFLQLPGGLAVSFAVAAVIAGPKIQSAIQYDNDFARPNTLAMLGDWFIQNVPQGGRTVVELATPFGQYAGFPGRSIYHQLTVDSIFNESVESYRSRGYQYLIWNSNQTRSVGELESPGNRQRLANVREVVRFLPDAGRAGPSIVVFEIPPLQQHPLYAWFSPAISFRGYDLDRSVFQPGETIQLMLYWESASTTKANYKVFVHFVDTITGHLAAGQDGPPDYGTTPTWTWKGDMELIRDQRSLLLPSDLKPGGYSLQVGMYDADTQERLPVINPQNQSVGDYLELQSVIVSK